MANLRTGRYPLPSRPIRGGFHRGPTIRTHGIGRAPNRHQQDPEDPPPSYMEVMRGIIMNGGAGSPRSSRNLETPPDSGVMSPTAIFTVEEQFMRELETQTEMRAADCERQLQQLEGDSGRSQGQEVEQQTISTIQVLFGFSVLIHMVQSMVVLCWGMILGSQMFMNDNFAAGAFALTFLLVWVACETFFVKVALVADHRSEIKMFNYWMKYLEVLMSIIVVVVLTLFFRDPQKLNGSNSVCLGTYFVGYTASYLLADLRLQEVKHEAGVIDA